MKLLRSFPIGGKQIIVFLWLSQEFKKYTLDKHSEVIKIYELEIHQDEDIKKG